MSNNWHLAQSDKEVEVTDFELQLWRVFYGFISWQEECEHSANGTKLTGNELCVLHVIRMRDRPKNVTEIARLLNRNDNHNIQYIAQKLIKSGLVQKTPNGKAFQITPKGIEDTDTYTKMRSKTLIDLYTRNNDLDLRDLATKLMRLKSIYDDSAQIVMGYATAPHEEAMEKPQKKKGVKPSKKSNTQE